MVPLEFSIIQFSALIEGQCVYHEMCFQTRRYSKHVQRDAAIFLLFIPVVSSLSADNLPWLGGSIHAPGEWSSVVASC